MQTISQPSASRSFSYASNASRSTNKHTTARYVIGVDLRILPSTRHRVLPRRSYVARASRSDAAMSAPRRCGVSVKRCRVGDVCREQVEHIADPDVGAADASLPTRLAQVHGDAVVRSTDVPCIPRAGREAWRSVAGQECTTPQMVGVVTRQASIHYGRLMLFLMTIRQPQWQQQLGLGSYDSSPPSAASDPTPSPRIKSRCDRA